MPSAHIVRSVEIKRTPRVQQCEGMFDIPISERSEERWEVNLPIEDLTWNIGLIVGPSGCGKSTIARELFGDALFSGFQWSDDAAIIDDFPREMSIKEIVALLSSVGFSSPPLWLRPYRVLSNGQKMRVDVARLLAEQPDLAVYDEFTSTVDRTVAQFGSVTIAKAVRARRQKFVAVTCHYDVIDWLQPDWVYQPHTKEFLRRAPARRPQIHLEIQRVHRKAWELFRAYHYLDHSLNRSARCFAAFYQDRPVAFVAVLFTPHPSSVTLFREHRLVCLPDYQGVGIGSALSAYVGSAYRALGYRYLCTTASPALNSSRARDPRWKMLIRLTTTWEYVGPPMDVESARRLVYG